MAGPLPREWVKSWGRWGAQGFGGDGGSCPISAHLCLPFDLCRGAAPQPPSPRLNGKRMHPAARIQVGQGSLWGERRRRSSPPNHPSPSAGHSPPPRYQIQPEPSPNPRNLDLCHLPRLGCGMCCVERCRGAGVGARGFSATPTRSQPPGDAVWRGNICSSFGACRELVVGALPHLLQLDAQPIHGGMGEEEEEGGSSSSEDEDKELLSESSGPFTAGKGAQTEAGHTWGLSRPVPLSPRVTEVAGSLGGCAGSPVILLPLPPSVPGRFLCGSAAGAGRALVAEAEAGPGGTPYPPGRAGGAAGASGSAAASCTAEPRQGGSSEHHSPATPTVSAPSPSEAGDAAATPTRTQWAARLPAAPATSRQAPAPHQGSGGGGSCQRRKK